MVWPICRGGFWPPRRWQTTFRRPHPVIPRQVAPQQSLRLFHWTKSERFPFPFPLVANPRTNTNKLSMCLRWGSRSQPDGFKGSIEFLAQINIMSVQGVEDFGWTAGWASHPRQ